jgi:hypothetical protein
VRAAFPSPVEFHLDIFLYGRLPIQNQIIYQGTTTSCKYSLTFWTSVCWRKFNLLTFYDSTVISCVLFQTRIQASTLSFPELISKLPQIGLQGLYRGSIPAIIGQFSRSAILKLYMQNLMLGVNSHPVTCSHGLRTGIFEASKLVLINVAPTLPDIQVYFITTFTKSRFPSIECRPRTTLSVSC